MKSKKVLLYCLTVVMLLSMTVGSVLAEDGLLFRRNISKTPDNETEKAAIYMMDFYVPAQSSDGIPLVDGIEYYLSDDSTQSMLQGEVPSEDLFYESRLYAKPLVSVWIDDLKPVDTKGGVTFGHFDAFVGVSMDDGTSWRTENLSKSSDLSSFTVIKENIPYAYPGDVHNVVHQVAEDKILAVWASKYCQSGFPLYSLVPEAEENDSYFTDLVSTYGKNAMYLYDLFGVAGGQGSVDYTEQGFPEIGEIPYSCIWTARGKILPGDDPKTTETEAVEQTHVVWTAPERLTSGVRDANLPAVDCAGGAGCALTWQEDPEGLRPGKGLGPGEGWSGAIANAKTDIWYSYITFADFDLVVNDDGDGFNESGEAMLIEEYEDLMLANMDRPKPYVPMAMPVRLTDNDMCKATTGTNSDNPEDPYCWIDFESIDSYDHTTITAYLDGLTGPEEDADFCAETESWTNSGGTTLSICVTEDGRWMNGRVASTRVRMAIKPYTPEEASDHDADGVPDKSAWLSLAAEETKALGVTVLEGTEFDPIDIGKDMFYYSFDYAKPYNLHVNTALDIVDDSAYVVQQGGMINQPAKCSPDFITTDQTHPDIVCEPDEFFEVQIDPITGYEYYLTEISRRFALTLNNIPNITNTEINDSGLAGMLIYKQGIIWQGGPADIMLRRVVVPEDFDATTDNPFAFENMECEYPDGTSAWVYPPDLSGTYSTNPNYLKGLCMAPAINITGSTIKTCTEIDPATCVSAFPVADDGTIPEDSSESDFPKVLEWRQCDGISDIDGCGDDNDLDDQSWENPYDVAKGHRGFLYGDMVMMMYAWSPNWKSNSVGNDHYNLYARRSFDGGLTWTTTPSDWCDAESNCGAGMDVLDYNYSDTIGDFVPVLYTYEAGEFEQGRNLSLLHGNKVTVLDPRYSPAGGLKQYSTIRTDWLEKNIGTPSETLPYPDDLAIDPSKFYIAYETGDNTTVAIGEATPLNLYYSRGTVFGDFYEWYDYVSDLEDGDPVDGLIELGDGTLIEPRFPWLENDQDIMSGEASVVLNPGGTFAYNVWNQWQEEITHYVDEYGIEHEEELVFDSDIIFRRLFWLPDGVSVDMNLVPVASILATSQVVYGIEEEEEQVISLYASARDLDKINDEILEPIQEYTWTINGVAIPVEFQEAYKEAGLDCFSGKECNAPARVLSENWDGREWSDPGGTGWSSQQYTGYVEFALQVKDNDDPEAKYSKVYKVKKYISQYNTDIPFVGFKIFLPLTTK